jgi:hypothetical protein
MKNILCAGEQNSLRRKKNPLRRKSEGHAGENKFLHTAFARPSTCFHKLQVLKRFPDARTGDEDDAGIFDAPGIYFFSRVATFGTERNADTAQNW